ncbi:MAG: phosphatidylserine decarboxylase family protein [Candidatus Neomarinimicrobiota bacterium]|tara:strand:+ start:1123 stop:1764 length:642 start_codon:yes stop_codon:yes gene_type:complete
MLAPEGKKILILLSLSTFIFGIIGNYYNYQILIIFYFISGILLIFSCNFFRDPIRNCISDELLIISPADGKIIRIDKINDDKVGENASRISIFLNVFNVHVNRVPFNAKVKEVVHKSGNFIAAYNHKASDENERTNTLFNARNFNYRVIQIAGLIARRIHCYARVNKLMKKGDRLGFIMFGSRTDIIFPSSIEIKAKIGQKVKGGETIIGKIS